MNASSVKSKLQSGGFTFITYPVFSNFHGTFFEFPTMKEAIKASRMLFEVVSLSQGRADGSYGFTIY